MKNIYLILLLTLSSLGYSQYNESAPWMKNLSETKKGKITFSESVNAFNSYWENKDYNKKGSGFKPFKRWEYFWETKLNPNGEIDSPNVIWDIWRNREQQRNSLVVPSHTWTPVGPFTHTNTGSWSSGQGRINVVTEDPSNPNTIYVGTPAGGIWKSTDAGSTWAALSDELPQIGVSGIAVDHTNSNVIYIATGDKDANDTYSVGVLKSTNGGTTWNTTGLTLSGTGNLAGDLIMHPTNNQILFCATSTGLYKTTNGGTSWTNVRSGSFHSGNIRFKPNNPNHVYATTPNNIYISTDGGNNFAFATTGLPSGVGRILLDVTASDENYVYALISNADDTFNGIYRSVDSGNNWVQTTFPASYDIFDDSTQASYDMALAVSQTNKDEFFTGCLNVWKSTDGGSTMSRINSWSNPLGASYTHADIHFLRFFGNRLYAGTDGGIYVSTNNGVNFTNKTNGLQIGQFYKIAVANQTAGNLMGGLQDNGGFAYSNNTWKVYYGADGMDTAIDPLDPNKFYGFIQFGSSMYISNNAGNSRASGVGKPATEPNGNWVTPLTANKLGDVYSGFTKLFRLNGSTWVQQSSGNIGTGNIELVTTDPSNENNMYVVNGTRLYKSTNKGVNFNLVYTASANIISICVHSSDSNTIYITTTGTGGNVLKSINGGSTFTAFSTGLPALSKLTVKHQGRHTQNPLYLGTTLGVYYRDDSMTQWEPFDNGLPNVPVQDLEINLEDGKIIAATYGRGVWQANIPVQPIGTDIKLVSIENPIYNISCNGNISPQITVKNNGTTVITNATITYDYNGTPQNYNWSGTINAGNSQAITIPSISTIKGAYNLFLTSTTTGDSFSDNNLGRTSFYTNDNGTVNTVNTFENSATNLLTYNEGAITSLWQRGINTTTLLATPGNNVYTSNLSGTYPNSVRSYLYSQCYDLTNIVSPRIKFKMGFDLEINYDIVYVEYSTNSGQNWNVLGTQSPNWYNSDRTPFTTGTDCEECVGAQWTGTNATLTEYFYPLNFLSGQANVMFRIVFVSDSGVVQEGVVIDDFVIEGTLPTQNFDLDSISIYPNPSKDIFTFSLGNKSIDNLQVYDVSGKVIFETKNSIQTEYKLDLTSVSNGIYFVKMTSQNQSTIKRIIKN